MPASANLQLKANLAMKKTGAFGAEEAINPVVSWSLDLLNGLGVKQIDKIFAASINIAGGGTQDYDLAGSLLDILGDAFAPVKIKGILIVADDGNTNDIVVGNDGAAFVGPFGAATHTVAVGPGGVLFVFDDSGWPVTATTADILQLLNSAGGTAVTGKLVLLGCSA